MDWLLGLFFAGTSHKPLWSRVVGCCEQCTPKCRILVLVAACWMIHVTAGFATLFGCDQGLRLTFIVIMRHSTATWEGIHPGEVLFVRQTACQTLGLVVYTGVRLLSTTVWGGSNTALSRNVVSVCLLCCIWRNYLGLSCTPPLGRFCQAPGWWWVCTNSC